MSEALVKNLITRSLDLQQAVMQELREDGADYVKNPTFAGLGRAALYEWGGAVTVDARLWSEQELKSNGTLFVEVDSVAYRVEIRQDTVEVRDAHTRNLVTDIETLERIMYDISFMHEVYLFNNDTFEDGTDKVVQ